MINAGIGFRIHGSVHHSIGSLLPEEGAAPTFAQLCIYDSDHELQNRLGAVPNFRLNPVILSGLQQMLHEHNPFVRDIKRAAAEGGSEGCLIIREGVICVLCSFQLQQSLQSLDSCQ